MQIWLIPIHKKVARITRDKLQLCKFSGNCRNYGNLSIINLISGNWGRSVKQEKMCIWGNLMYGDLHHWNLYCQDDPCHWGIPYSFSFATLFPINCPPCHFEWPYSCLRYNLGPTRLKMTNNKGCVFPQTYILFAWEQIFMWRRELFRAVFMFVKSVNSFSQSSSSIVQIWICGQYISPHFSGHICKAVQAWIIYSLESFIDIKLYYVNEWISQWAHATGRFRYVTAPSFIWLALSIQWES